METKKRLRELIVQRRYARRLGCKDWVRDICTLLKKEIKAVEKARKSVHIAKILAEFKDLRRIAVTGKEARRYA